MPQNYELKARISSTEEAVRLARDLHARAKGILRQRDIYYKVSRGRLKLRIMNNRTAEFIYYNRSNKKGGRYSDYVVLPVNDATLAHTLCTAAFGMKVEVQKRRRLFLYKNSRIHVDDVRGLGTFIEFEVLVKNGKHQAHQLLEFLSAKFNIHRSAVVSGSYSDLVFTSKRMR
jgi:predicted adenylyl cyclase CyaB